MGTASLRQNQALGLLASFVAGDSHVIQASPVRIPTQASFQKERQNSVWCVNLTGSAGSPGFLLVGTM
jgi:hypothetical protein